MATAQETVVNVVLLNSTGNNGAVVYTCPAGRYAEVYVQYVRSFFSDGSGTGWVEVGEVVFPSPSDPGGADAAKPMYATNVLGQGIQTGTAQVTQMGSDPIIIDQGQTIIHNDGTFNVSSSIVAVIKEFNRP